MNHLFKAIPPGNRMILGIADSTPPQAVFDRLSGSESGWRRSYNLISSACPRC